MRRREKLQLSLWLIPWRVLDLGWPSTVVPNWVNGAEPFVSLHPQSLEVGHPLTESVTSGRDSSQSSEPLAASIPEAGDECVDPEEGLWAESHTTAPACWMPRMSTRPRKDACSLPWWSRLAALSQRGLQHCLFSFNYHGYAPFHSNREVSQSYMCNTNVYVKAGICD